jgi:predicted Zn finger-like uncharacterized protein
VLAVLLSLQSISMSSITRCPACGTLFKVVTDQLKISEGWVRCGKCREVFDASASLAAGVQGITSLPASADSSGSGAQSEAGNSQTKKSLTAIKNAVVSGFALPKKKQDFSSSDWINSVNPPAPYEDSFSSADSPPSLMPQDFTQSELASSDLAPLFVQSSLGQTSQTTPSFVRQAQRVQRWNSPWARAGWFVLGLILVAGLLIQIASQESNRIAAAQPRTVPWLQELCQITGCAMGPLKQIESVLVDASGFSKLRTDGKYEFYKIALNLKNNGTLAVAVPSIELSLNDSQDQPVLRRVLSASDLGVTQSTISPAAELSGGATIQIDSTQLAGARIAGYRMLAFYP